MSHSRKDLDEFLRRVGTKTSEVADPAANFTPAQSLQSLAEGMRRRGIALEPEEETGPTSESTEVVAEEVSESAAGKLTLPEGIVDWDTTVAESLVSITPPIDEPPLAPPEPPPVIVAPVISKPAPDPVVIATPVIEELPPAPEVSEREQRLRSDMFKVAEAAGAFSPTRNRLLEDLREDDMAGSRQHVCTPMRYFETHGYLTGDVLDYGCGRDPHDFAKYDPTYNESTQVFFRRWRTVTCNYVADTLLHESQRTSLMLALRGLVSNGGQALLSVRRTDADLSEAHSQQRPDMTQNQWTEFLGKFWNVRLLESKGFWSWRLWHPESLVESAQVSAPPTSQPITVGPIIINVPERDVTVNNTVEASEIVIPEIKIPVEVQIDSPIQVDIPPQPPAQVKFEEGALKVDVHAPPSQAKRVVIQKDSRGVVTGKLEPIAEEAEEPPLHPEVARALRGE